ncbi:MAG: 2,3-bisphosphoglycerate-independent phosphoglycerate mutase [Sedimentisphaerales bacterium]|nr:2,3-bisphosphoglycerate-independent phosphoglycerate mutase [Sedimentisphaerales bacterium]MBN2841469.1 2,3-bisphosphoglycerate-independent phosphoglycerate mutase [Sedimentisphaerales bacterium]
MTSKKLRTKPFVLIIRDGWGWNPDEKLHKYDATRLANTPNDDRLRAEYPFTLIGTSGEDVGLPAGTMGNSEVGHQNIGAGRIVYQESMRLTKAIREGEFQKNEVLLGAINGCKQKGTKLHLIGLASDIGVHSLLGHLYALVQMCKDNGLTEVYIHPLMDGRDSPPSSGKGYLTDIQAELDKIGAGTIASVAGRFYGMDRDQRWDRVEKAFNAMRKGIGNKATNAIELMQASYDNGVTDEFVEPTNIVDASGKPVATIDDGDAVVFFNFRGDRPREITRAFVDPEFTGFERGPKPEIDFICLTQYDKTIPAKVAFTKPAKMKNIAGELLSIDGLKQFRCAETEKYAHVTFFFNDYTESPFGGEDRQIIPSPKVRTYDEKPEMSAYEVCDAVMAKLDSNEYDIIIVNFANPDMVGHTGIMAAAIKAAEVVDECVGKIVSKVESMGGSALITADHGNLELMWDESTNGPMTAHTTYPVPLIVVDKEYKGQKLKDGGILADVVPTCLKIMGLEQPVDMTGKSLI